MHANVKRDYFNQLAERWDGMPTPPDAPARVARFVDRAVRPGSRLILDVGCGTGVLLPALREAAGVARIVETDIAERMLAENRRKRAAGLVEHVCAEALRMPFPEQQFDTVLCFGVLPHLGDPDAALARLWTNVKSGGVLAVGHLMGSGTLNTFHAALPAPVNQDRLPSAEAVACLLSGLGGAVLAAEDAPDWYFVAAERA